MSENYNQLLNLKESPNFEYLDALEDEELKCNMLQIISCELSDYCQDIENMLEEKEPYDVFIIVHKLSTKFSILGMKNTYKFVKKIESDLKNNEVNLADHIQLKSLSEKLLSNLENGHSSG